MEFQFFSRNGKVLPIGEAVVPLSSIEYAYGFGVYETLRVVRRNVLFVADHIERLERSAEQIGLTHSFGGEVVGKAINDLVAATDSETYNLKILLIGGRTSEDAVLNIMCLNPLFPDKKLYSEGAKTITYAYERAFPHAKTLNMLQSYLAYRKAREAGAYDALLINRGGCITEGTRTNFFCIKDDTLYSPPEKDLLLGVTRKHVLEVAAEAGFTIEHVDIPFADLSKYEGAFLTSTSTKVMPIKSVDDFVCGVRPQALTRLMSAFGEFLSVIK